MRGSGLLESVFGDGGHYYYQQWSSISHSCCCHRHRQVLFVLVLPLSLGYGVCTFGAADRAAVSSAAAVRAPTASSTAM